MLRQVNFLSKVRGRIWLVVGGGVVAIEAVFANLTGIKGIPWFVNAILGISGITLISIKINSRVLEYCGKASLIIMCFHGPVYRLLVKLGSIVTNISTDTYRGDLGLVLIISIITIPICLIIYQIVIRYVLWIIGKYNKRILNRE